jgi:RimJ/RimL family protein N-acetyltransferase
VRATREELDRYVALYRPGESDEAMFERQVEQARPRAGAAESVRLVGVMGDGRIAGGFNLNAISRGLEWKADVTWWVAAGFRRQGLGLEGVRALAEHALAELPAGLGLHAVHAWITAENGASIRLAERAGFRRAEDRSYLQTGERWAMIECFVSRVG